MFKRFLCVDRDSKVKLVHPDPLELSVPRDLQVKVDPLESEDIQDRKVFKESLAFPDQPETRDPRVSVEHQDLQVVLDPQGYKDTLDSGDNKAQW